MAPAQAAGAAAQAPPGHADHRLLRPRLAMLITGPWRFLEEPDLLEPIVPLLLPQAWLP